MTSIKWEELECLKSWDMTGLVLEELELEDFKDFEVTTEMWEEMRDLKDALFFVDLDRDRSIFYNPAVASELGGYIHIRGKMDNSVYSYHVNYKTIVPSPMPSPVLSTSHVSINSG
uniref:uncharacterized protein LOC122583854 n=1 Tax=Erigeron canadensis TaxID=72917 RepID=UPI001CB8F086|nr:uncharacterized protein LOC122583854 [Erigeron canadensis]